MKDISVSSKRKRNIPNRREDRVGNKKEWDIKRDFSEEVQDQELYHLSIVSLSFFSLLFFPLVDTFKTIQEKRKSLVGLQFRQ